MMKKEALTRILVVVLVGVMFSTLVSAQPSGTVLDSLTRILGGGSLPQFYDSYYQWIDLLVYLLLFTFIAKSSLGRMVRDQGYHSKLPVVLGVVLGISAAVFESQVSFRLSDVGPLAIGILFAIIGFTIYQFISGSGFAGRSTWAFAYVIAYGFTAAVAPQYYVWLQTNTWFLFLSSLLDILFLVAIGVIIFTVFGFVTGRGGTPAATPVPTPPHPAVTVAHHEAAEIDRIQQELSALIRNRALTRMQRIVEVRRLVLEMRAIRDRLVSV
jgi:hypothetical protein